MIVVEGEAGRLPEAMQGGAVALGNFDGVHRGHQVVIGAAVTAARAAGRPAVVATFDPHPSLYFRPGSPPFALTTCAQKLALIEGLGVDAAVVIPFNAALAGLSAEDFARNWLRDRMGVSHVVTGEDFTFGKGRSGSAETLKQLGAELGFTAEAIRPVTADAETISSTRIREALMAGDMPEATHLLTRPFAIRAPVIHGDKRGRTIGVPTANQELGAYQRPRYGVYAVRVRLPDGRIANGVANIGVRPMFDPPKELLETWILDWSGDLYGADIEVELVAWLRPELRLDGLDALKAQIAKDAEEARAVLARA
jgi:riboflavin kinase/FMN adenylyltransferase